MSLSVIEARLSAVPARRTALTKPIGKDGYGACGCDKSGAGNGGYEVDSLAYTRVFK